MNNSNLKSKTLWGIIWSVLERFSVQGIYCVVSIIIARIISPSDYGLIAMLNIFIAIAQSLIDSGFSNALIQKQDRTEEDFCTVFYFNTFIALILYIILYVISPYIASFYAEPRLEDIAKWSSITIIISALSIINRTKITINIAFKTLAKISIYAVTISGALGIICAYLGYGVWALVIQNITRCTVETILLWCYVHWFPNKKFSWKSFNSLFAFGSRLLLAGLLHTLYTNLYSLIIGKKFTPNIVGYYNQSNTLASFPALNFSFVLTRVMYPVMCQLQHEDQKLNEYFIKYLCLATYIIAPIMIMLSVLSEQFITVILSSQWKNAAPYLAILCLANLFLPLREINGIILNVKGRSDLFFKAEVIKKAASFTILFATLPFGVKIMCLGQVLYSILDLIIIIFFVKKVTNITYKTELRHIIPIILNNIIMAILVYIITLHINNSFLCLAAGIICGITTYLILSILFKSKELKFILNLWRTSLLSRS